MQKLIVISLLALSLATPAQGADPTVTMRGIHKDLLSKFTPKIYRKGEQKLLNHSGEEPFLGDCVDFYVAAHRQLEKYGYRPYARFLHRKRDNEGHLVACVDKKGKTRCLDPNSNRPQTLRRLHKEYRTVKVNRG